jgi:hypothetical protein
MWGLESDTSLADFSQFRISAYRFINHFRIYWYTCTWLIIKVEKVCPIDIDPDAAPTPARTASSSRSSAVGVSPRMQFTSQFTSHNNQYIICVVGVGISVKQVRIAEIPHARGSHHLRVHSTSTVWFFLNQYKRYIAKFNGLGILRLCIRHARPVISGVSYS